MPVAVRMALRGAEVKGLADDLMGAPTVEVMPALRPVPFGRQLAARLQAQHPEDQG